MAAFPKRRFPSGEEARDFRSGSGDSSGMPDALGSGSQDEKEPPKMSKAVSFTAEEPDFLSDEGDTQSPMDDWQSPITGARPDVPTGDTGAARTEASPLKAEFRDWSGVHDRYDLRKIVGSGSYGKVAEAYSRDAKAPEKVAIKQCESVFGVLREAKQMYRELYILRTLTGSEHIIKLKDVLAPPRADGRAFKDLYLVFEWADMDVHKLIHSPQFITARHVQSFAYQLLKGVKFMQSANVIHRDLKPANILVTTDCQLKICDFGLSRVVSEDKILDGSRRYLSPSAAAAGAAGGTAQTDSSQQLGGLPKPILSRVLTTHVVTRWYRAPEIILQQDYTSAVDMWSVGCIVAELLDMLDTLQIPPSQRRALFPGRSCYPLSNSSESGAKDTEQLSVIFDVLGTPSDLDISAVPEPRARAKLAKETRRAPLEPLGARFKGAPSDLLALVARLLLFDPVKRATCAEALSDACFLDIRNLDEELVCPVKLHGDLNESDAPSEASRSPPRSPPPANAGGSFSLSGFLQGPFTAVSKGAAPSEQSAAPPKRRSGHVTESALRKLMEMEVAHYEGLRRENE